LIAQTYAGLVQNYSLVVRTPPGLNGRQGTNPLNTTRQRQPPPKVGRQSVKMQNWRPGEKMLGPDETQGVQLWEPTQGACAGMTALPFSPEPANIDLYEAVET
jgi:hypothetical protein